MFLSRNYDSPGCDWFTTPAKPGTRRAAVAARTRRAAWTRFLAHPEVKAQVCRIYRFKPSSCAGL